MAGSISSENVSPPITFYAAAHALMRPRPSRTATSPKSSASITSVNAFAKPEISIRTTTPKSNHAQDPVELSSKESQRPLPASPPPPRMSVFVPSQFQIDYDEQLRILDLDAITALHRQGRPVFDRPHQYKLYNACFLPAAGSAHMRSVDRLSLIIWLEGLVATLAESHHASLGNCIDVSCRLLDYAFNDLNSTPGQFITLEPSSTFLRTIELVQTVYLSFLGFVGVVGDSSEKTFLQLFQDQVQIGIHDALQQPVATTQSTDSIVRLYESLRKSFPLSVLDKQSNAPNSSQPLLLHPENIGLSESKIRNMDILGWHQDGFVVITPTNLWTQHLETTVANGMLTIYIYNTLSPVFRLFNYHRISSLKALENSTQVTHLCSIGQSLDTTTRLLFHTTSSRKWAADHGIATVELTVNVQDASLRPIENTPPANLIYRRLQILQYVLGHPVMCIVRDIYVRSHAAPLSSYTTIILGLFGLVVLIARSVLQGSRRKWLQILSFRRRKRSPALV